MNAIQQIEAEIRADFPNAKCEIEPPLHLDTGYWHLDITNGPNTVFVLWNLNQGFGVSYDGKEGTDREIGFGEGPQKVFGDQAKALEEIRKMLNE